MANTQINITENGTKTLATAGKYCDRNIDVNVNVTPKSPDFVNVLEYADSLEVNKKFATNGSYTTTQPNSCIAVTLDLRKLPYGNNLKRDNNEIRFRGCSHGDSSFAQSEDGVSYAAKELGIDIKEIDEWHDAIYKRGYITGPYVRFNIYMASYSTSSNPVLADDFDPIAAGCIVTFNQPIGNPIALTEEIWQFILEDGTTIEKVVSVV